jgi:hypothetical protein
MMKVLIETLRLAAILLILTMGIIGIVLAFAPEPPTSIGIEY